MLTLCAQSGTILYLSRKFEFKGQNKLYTCVGPIQSSIDQLALNTMELNYIITY